MPNRLYKPSLCKSLTVFRVTSYGVVRSGPWRYHISSELALSEVSLWNQRVVWNDILLGVQSFQRAFKVLAQALVHAAVGESVRSVYVGGKLTSGVCEMASRVGSIATPGLYIFSKYMRASEHNS